MQFPVSVRSALISVYDKSGLTPLLQLLHASGVKIYSTGGTAAFISEMGIPVAAVEDLTGYPSILGGRVKTLHPKVFGGILARRDNETDRQELNEFTIPEFDLVVVDLYPFEKTVSSTNDEKEIIEKIDIGGVSLIRAAAKNYRDVVVAASSDVYEELLQILRDQKGVTGLEQRKYFAEKAFGVTSRYDRMIHIWFGGNTDFSVSYEPKTDLRYGENPHQHASFYGRLTDVFEQLHGKEISYNNLVDIESGIYLIEEFSDELHNKNRPAFAVIKHTNACGLATGKSVPEAWEKALAADPVSAFGGVLICNAVIDEKSAASINELFFEILIAPDFAEEALGILRSKKNRILLRQKTNAFPDRQFRSILNGVLVQDRNKKITTADMLQFVTKKHPAETEISDLLFAEKTVKHLKSNGIAIVKDQQLIGSGTGQTSRVDALQQAIAKARAFGFSVEGAVMASEAFFPFADSVEIAHRAGISAILQPGGSIRDKDSIAYCDMHNMVMVFSGTRHFKH